MQCVSQILLNPLKIDLGFLADNSPVMFLRVDTLLRDGTEDVSKQSRHDFQCRFLNGLKEF